ncbi:hypothetical protein [Amycolatopsis sp. NPDC021455]|uniref:hypothetical protein n=1 Tax=Amycolatopsis sp. NPDC021455 TaxID=3154901 RepID=UPI0033C8CDB9
MNITQIISQIGTVAVAIFAIAANVWTARQTLQDKREERLWQSRADLYVDLVRLVLEVGRIDAKEYTMIADNLDKEPNTYWQSPIDRRTKEWQSNSARVWSYASDETRDRYLAWTDTILRLAGTMQPERVTGQPRPRNLPSAIEKAIDNLKTAGDKLLNQIRSELKSDR